MLDYIACSDPWMVRTILGWSNTADSEHVELCFSFTKYIHSDLWAPTLRANAWVPIVETWDLASFYWFPSAVAFIYIRQKSVVHRFKPIGEF